MKRIFLTLFGILSASIACMGQSTYYLPQIADGQAGATGWVTAVAITNPAAPGTPAANVTLTFTKDDGTAFNLFLTDQQLRPVPLSAGSTTTLIAGGQTKFFVSTGLSSGITTGYATVTSNLPVVVGAIFTEYSTVGSGSLIAQAGVAQSTALTQQGIVVDQYNSDTGIAVANPGTSPDDVSFQLLDVNGVAALPVVTKTLNAKTHTSFFVSQLFTNLPTGFFGTLRITSTVPVTTTALLFGSGGIFATLPVFPLQ